MTEQRSSCASACAVLALLKADPMLFVRPLPRTLYNRLFRDTFSPLLLDFEKKKQRQNALNLPYSNRMHQTVTYALYCLYKIFHSPIVRIEQKRCSTPGGALFEEKKPATRAGGRWKESFQTQTRRCALRSIGSLSSLLCAHRLIAKRKGIARTQSPLTEIIRPSYPHLG